MAVYVARGMIKSLWTPVIAEELILEAEDGNEHDKHAGVVMNDEFVFGHISIRSPGNIGIYRCHSQ